ncbi:MAG TPA: Fe-S-containing protein [Bryobacteraceae bacterium]|nr:Fe-S-containing protein [Bryobacteraceae bacterium]
MRARKQKLHITWREAWPVWLTFILLFGFGAFGVWIYMPAAEPAPKALLNGEDAVLRVADLKLSAPQVFAYPLEPDRAVEFFVERKGKDGIVAAFARCRRCYRSGQYRQSGQIFCGHCNEPMVRLGQGQAPASEIDCTQIPIQLEKSSETVAVRASAVREAFAQWYAPILSKSISDDGRR